MLALALLVVTAGTSAAALRDVAIGEQMSSRRPPRIVGEAQVGQVLRADPGAPPVERAPALPFQFQWRVCEARGLTCVDIEGATDRIYPIRPADVGRRVAVAVTIAPPAASTFTGQSPPTPVIRAAPVGAPVATEPPEISGSTVPGSTLTAVAGAWAGEQPIRARFAWRRCGPQGGACEAVAGGRSTYRVTTRDLGRSFRVLVAAVNAISTSGALSAATAPVGPAPSPPARPRNASPPSISGIVYQGRTVTASTGSWVSATPVVFTFEWRRCGSSARSRCVGIPGATQQTYTVVAADVGHRLQARVTARNTAGARTALSGRSDVVAGPTAPLNTAPPTLTGAARVGTALVATTGTWQGTAPIRYAYRWLRCNARGDACDPLRGATDPVHVVVTDDVGHTLRVRVTAENPGGSSSAVSTPSALIAPVGTAPANRAAPVLSGAAEQGARLSLSAGSWTGSSPITFGYQWMRCDASLRSCGAIGGATGSTYVLVRADTGHRLVGIVTARNAAGTSSASSNATSVVVGAPVNNSQPTISGTPVEGLTLRADPGAWVGRGPMSFGYQWTRCASAEFSSCAPIVVTAVPTYMLRLADVGHRIFVQVKALNEFGASYVNSAQTAPVEAAPVGTVTAWSVRGVVVYGGAVVLTGRAVGATAGKLVTVIEQPVGRRPRLYERAAVTGANGIWRYMARPMVRTSYRVQVAGRTSPAVTIRVKPRLRLGRVARGTLSLRVHAAQTFPRRTAFLQRWRPARHRWVTVGRVRLRATGIGQPPTRVSAATVRTRLPRGTLVRVVFTSGQAGSGYSTGISNRVRT